MKTQIPTYHGVLWLIVAAPCLGLLGGCDSTGHARFTPTKDVARSSLEAALSAWRDGQPTESVKAKPPVRVADSVWQGGQQIESFQVGDEEDPGDGTKQFAVKLTMKKTREVKEVRYVVNGLDPVWVYNGDDYRHFLDMDNKPVSPPARSAPGRLKRR
jgi:hypothetical protein